jgi:hypothetical protein
MLGENILLPFKKGCGFVTYFRGARQNSDPRKSRSDIPKVQECDATEAA